MGRQAELALSFSVGDFVWAKRRWGNNQRRYLARIESATPIRTGDREVWAVRIYRGTDQLASSRKLAPGWQPVEHREIASPLNPTEVADLRKKGVIPMLGQALP